MTKTFEEELFNKVPCKFELTTEAEYKKSTLINHFKNWHSDEEFYDETNKLTNQLITRNDELISSNYEIESLKSQLVSREKQVMELKESDKAQVKEIVQLKSQLQQQALPVVPECVYRAIKQFKNDQLSLYGSLNAILSDRTTEIYAWISRGNQNAFALAFITGKYEVEKPQLFYIELPNVYGLSDSVFVSKVENGTILEFTKGKDYALAMTEQEIKSIDKRYWQFAVPVEDGE
ncbi:DUF1642 domain-containing protein [Lactococcus lactis]|uniref:DUF1642 domain-containing protein n=1 Tax=Lactococcus lactis TaxID=1358 RepID=UPI001C1F5EA8|nr:DUF1642 domain-containing protein [Lactococcus lactis]MBU7533437.1 DUF1642 domain-containing protein [Lactococcus lactis]